MRTAVLIAVGLVVAALASYVLLFPRNSFFVFRRPGGSTITLSRTAISFEPAPDHFAANGFSHIEPYVSRLLVPASHYKFLTIFTPDGNRGFGLSARDGQVEASFTLQWKQEGQRESAVRAFFKSVGTAPTQDYLAGNGGVPDATRVLAYPIHGSTTEVTALTKRILAELCGVSPAEGLDIQYGEK